MMTALEVAVFAGVGWLVGFVWKLRKAETDAHGLTQTAIKTASEAEGRAHTASQEAMRDIKAAMDASNQALHNQLAELQADPYSTLLSKSEALKTFLTQSQKEVEEQKATVEKLKATIERMNEEASQMRERQRRKLAIATQDVDRMVATARAARNQAAHIHTSTSNMNSVLEGLRAEQEKTHEAMRKAAASPGFAAMGVRNEKFMQAIAASLVPRGTDDSEE